MARKAINKSSTIAFQSFATIGCEGKWGRDSNKRRNNMDAAEYKHVHMLTPDRYVRAEEVEDDSEPFERKMERLVTELQGQFKELEKAIQASLGGLSYVL